jgi:hypothetical protein
MLRRNADRKGYLEGICLSETNNSSTIREAQQKQRLDKGTHKQYVKERTTDPATGRWHS